MAGGEGTRLRPLTSSEPKPMLPVANRSLLEHVLALVRRHGFCEVIVTVAFAAEAIRAAYGDGSEHGVSIRYSAEQTPLGTAGSVRAALAGGTGPALVVSGDVLTDMDLGALARHHARSGAELTVALARRPDPGDFGVVAVGASGRVEGFLEKPTPGRVFSDTVNTGVYVLEPSALDDLPAGAPADFSADVLPRLLAGGRHVQGMVVGGYWEDVGTLEAYLRANQDLLEGRVRAEARGFDIGGRVFMGEKAEVHPSAIVEGPALIGSSCRVGAGARLAAGSVLGSNVHVGEDARIERSVVLDNCYIGPGVHLRGGVVGRASRLREGCRMEEGAVLGEGCVVGEGAVIGPGVSVYPAKTVEPGAAVTSSIIWESRGARDLFTGAGAELSGLANVDVGPELALRLAMAYATTMDRGARVVVSRDTSRAGRVLERAVMVGLNSAGVDVVDLGVATVPVTRWAVRSSEASGAVTVRLVAGDPQSVQLRCFDSEGIDLSGPARKRIERIHRRRDFRRCLAGEIGDLVPAAGAAEDYTAALGEVADVAAVRGAGLKVVLDYSYGAASFVMPNVLAKLGADVLSVNPYASTRQALGFDRDAHAEEVARLVSASRASLGAVIDPDGERLTVVDDTGRILSDQQALVALLDLVLAPGAGGTSCPGADPGAGAGPAKPTVALDLTASRSATSLCSQRGAQVVLTGLSATDLLDAASGPGVVFAAGSDGGYVFPRLLPAFDAVATLVVALGLLALRGEPLSDLIDRIDPVPVAHRKVSVPPGGVGAVMRKVLEMVEGRELVLVDGVKASDPGGWVMVAPDPASSSVHVWAEGADAAESAERADGLAAAVDAAAYER